jgi:hypothetical protein
VADVALPMFRDAGDDLGIAKAVTLGSEPDHPSTGEVDPFRQANEQALGHLRRVNDRLLVPAVLRSIAHAVAIEPIPASEAIARMEQVLQDAAGDPELTARVRLRSRLSWRCRRREGEAIEAVTEAEAVFRDLGVELSFASAYSASWPAFSSGCSDVSAGRRTCFGQVMRSTNDRANEVCGRRSWPSRLRCSSDRGV